MEPYEQIGKTLEEARLLALEHLGVSEDEVEIEVLDEGSKGFLGLMQNPARIRVTLKAEGAGTQPEENAEGRISDPSPHAPDAPTEPPSGERPSGEEICRFVQEVLDAMGMDAQAVVLNDEPEQVDIEIAGEDTALLIGKHGQTLTAFQVLVTHIVNRKSSQWVRVLLDAEHYRERHEESLRELALRLARDVKRKGQEAIVFEARDARERRIVHMALVDDPDVYTYSEGDGDERRVVISPKS